MSRMATEYNTGGGQTLEAKPWSIHLAKEIYESPTPDYQDFKNDAEFP